MSRPLVRRSHPVGRSKFRGAFRATGLRRTWKLGAQNRRRCKGGHRRSGWCWSGWCWRMSRLRLDDDNEPHSLTCDVVATRRGDPGVPPRGFQRRRKSRIHRGGGDDSVIPRLDRDPRGGIELARFKCDGRLSARRADPRLRPPPPSERGRLIRSFRVSIATRAGWARTGPLQMWQSSIRPSSRSTPSPAASIGAGTADPVIPRLDRDPRGLGSNGHASNVAIEYPPIEPRRLHRRLHRGGDG